MVLTKSPLPKIKAEKECALQEMAAEYRRVTGICLSDKQLMKKINNMKNDVPVKVKSDVSKTGNKPIKLKKWEKLFLDLMQQQNSSVISGVKGK